VSDQRYELQPWENDRGALPPSWVARGQLDEDGNLQRPEWRRDAPDLHGHRLLKEYAMDPQDQSLALARAGGRTSLCRDLIDQGRAQVRELDEVAFRLSQRYGGPITQWQSDLEEAVEHRRRAGEHAVWETQPRHSRGPEPTV
jgi:hypothetical protein